MNLYICDVDARERETIWLLQLDICTIICRECMYVAHTESYLSWKTDKCCFDCVFYALYKGVRNDAKLDLHKYELFGYVHRGKLGS